MHATEKGSHTRMGDVGPRGEKLTEIGRTKRRQESKIEKARRKKAGISQYRNQTESEREGMGKGRYGENLGEGGGERGSKKQMLY